MSNSNYSKAFMRLLETQNQKILEHAFKNAEWYSPYYDASKGNITRAYGDVYGVFTLIEYIHDTDEFELWL